MSDQAAFNRNPVKASSSSFSRRDLGNRRTRSWKMRRRLEVERRHAYASTAPNVAAAGSLPSSLLRPAPPQS